MKTFPLASFASQGKRNGPCSLDIDEDANRVEVWRKSGVLGRGRSVIARFDYGADTVVQAEGRVLSVGGMEAAAPSVGVAAEIAGVLAAPRMRLEQRAKDVAEAESAALSFLQAREDSLTFLARLMADPRGAMLPEAQKWADQAKDPLTEILGARSRALEAGLSGFNAALAKAEPHIGSEKVSKAWAAVYAIGSVQNGLLSGRTDFTPELALLGGTAEGDIRPGDLKLGSVTERVGRRLLEGAFRPQQV